MQSDVGIVRAMIWEGITVEQAKEWLWKRMLEGETCPCCGQFAKMYPRKLNANMTVFLIDLVKLSMRRNWDWVHYSECNYTGRDYNYLPLWGLAITERETEGDKSHTGDWKPTQTGVDFVFNKISVPSHLWVYDNRNYGSPPNATAVTVVDTIGKSFSYRELMGWWDG